MDLFISMAIWWAPVVVLAGILQAMGRGAVGWLWLAAAVAAFALYSVAIFYAPLIPGFPRIEGAQYNWTGKAAAIATTLAMMLVAMRASPAITRETLGLTLRQNAGSLRPALLATAAMIAIVVTLQLIGGDGQPPDAETLAYQAIVPGIDEELIFRGLLLALVATALAKWQHGWRWAGVFVTVIFAFGHSFFYMSEGSQFDPVALVVTGVLGGLMMFIRLRTGSIAIPILAHNLTNVANQLA